MYLLIRYVVKEENNFTTFCASHWITKFKPTRSLIAAFLPKTSLRCWAAPPPRLLPAAWEWRRWWWRPGQRGCRWAWRSCRCCSWPGRRRPGRAAVGCPGSGTTAQTAATAKVEKYIVGDQLYWQTKRVIKSTESRDFRPFCMVKTKLYLDSICTG